MADPVVSAAAVLAARWLPDERPGALGGIGADLGAGQEPLIITVDQLRLMSDEETAILVEALCDLHNATLWVPSQPSGPLTAVLAEVAACVETTAGMAATKDGMSPAQWQGDIDSDVAALVDCMGAPTDRYRVRLIRIAALAVAAALSWDRRQGAAKPQAGVPHG